VAISKQLLTAARRKKGILPGGRAVGGGTKATAVRALPLENIKDPVPVQDDGTGKKREDVQCTLQWKLMKKSSRWG